MKISLKTENFVPVHTKACFLPDGTVEVRKVDKEQPDENTYLKTKNLTFHAGTTACYNCLKMYSFTLSSLLYFQAPSSAVFEKGTIT